MKAPRLKAPRLRPPRVRRLRGPADWRGQLGAIEMTKRGVTRFDLRDPYYLAATLSWSRFALLFVGVDLLLNLIFAVLYGVWPGSILNLQPDPITGPLFFSFETLSGVGYGVMSPGNLYGHIVAAMEMLIGLAWTAIMTGLTFVRFARPRARFMYAERPVVASYNGTPTLMIRLANGRTTLMTDANARLSVLLPETTREGRMYRRAHDLTLVRSHVAMFVVTWTLMHRIDEHSPLYGYGPERLSEEGARMFLTLQAHDPGLTATVQDLHVYNARDVAFGMRFADAVSIEDSGRVFVDLTRISHIEPDLMEPDTTDPARAGSVVA